MGYFFYGLGWTYFNDNNCTGTANTTGYRTNASMMNLFRDWGQTDKLLDI